MKKRIMGFLLIFCITFISLPISATELENRYLQYASKESIIAEIQEVLKEKVYNIYIGGKYRSNKKTTISNSQTEEKEVENILEVEDTLETKDGLETKDLSQVESILKVEEVPKVKDIPQVQDRDKEKEKPKGKVAYLTFDDGPSTTVTPQILDILNEYDIKATFFILGKMAEKNPDIVKRIQSEGHSIGNHTYSHDYKHIYKNMDNFLGELNKADEVFKNTLGQEFSTRLLRFPGGSFEKYKQKYKTAAMDLGYRVYDWNALNGDSEAKKVSAEKQISRLKQTTRGQKELLVLMHDTYGKENTAKALPSMINYLIDNGYTFDKLEQ